MRRFGFLLLAAILALGAISFAGSRIAPDGVFAVAHDDHGNNDKGGDHGDDDKADDRDNERDDRSGRDHPEDDGSQPTSQAASTNASGTLEVHTAGERFSPATLTIEVGQSVTFVNDDDDEHTATGTTFDTGKMDEGDSVTITFNEPGTFAYVCQFHADMSAEIVVLPVGGTPQATPAASPAASPEASPAASTASGEEVAIDILNFEFSPATLTIVPGTTVVWTNASPTQHTVTGDFADSGILESGDTFSWTFDAPGTYDYICALHPNMQAQIVVAAS